MVQLWKTTERVQKWNTANLCKEVQTFVDLTISMFNVKLIDWDEHSTGKHCMAWIKHFTWYSTQIHASYINFYQDNIALHSFLRGEIFALSIIVLRFILRNDAKMSVIYTPLFNFVVHYVYILPIIILAMQSLIFYMCTLNTSI